MLEELAEMKALKQKRIWGYWEHTGGESSKRWACTDVHLKATCPHPFHCSTINLISQLNTEVLYQFNS